MQPDNPGAMPPGQRPQFPQDVQIDQLQASHGSDADRQSRLEYLRSLAPEQRPPSKMKRLGIVLLTLIVLGGAGFGAYRLANHHSRPKPTTQKTSVVTTPTATPTKQYTSEALGLSFNYPQNWAVSEQNGVLTAKSPTVQLYGANGKKVNGQIVFNIAPMGQNLNNFAAGNATAVIDSQKISYTNPGSTQRAQTYLSYLQYAKTTTSNALDAIYVTGDFGYQKGQAIPQVDAAKLDPMVQVTFAACGSQASDCANGASTTNVDASAWQSNSLNKTVTTLIESLAFN